MNLDQLKKDLTTDEGRRHQAYVDPLSGGEPITIGIGHAVHGMPLSTVWTDAQIDDAYEMDVQHAIDGLRLYIPWFQNMNDVRQNVFLNMAFEMGAHGLLGFPKMLNAAHAGDFETASAEGIKSVWDGQVHARATRLMEELRTGEYA